MTVYKPPTNPGDISSVLFTSQNECLSNLRSLVAVCDWDSGLGAWQKVHRSFSAEEKAHIFGKLEEYRKAQVDDPSKAVTQGTCEISLC